MTTQAHYVLELENTARKHIQTPVSYIGGYKMIWHRTAGALAKAGWGFLLFLYWLVVTTVFYILIFSTLFLWIPWLIYTQARRHRIRAAREALATRDRNIGSGAMEG